MWVAAMSKILELFGISTRADEVDWEEATSAQQCPYLHRKCVKVRKSEPDVAIGTCLVEYGRDAKPIVICPHRLLERRQIFVDCLHLLSLHEPGNELHLVPEITVPGGSVDYVLVSARGEKVLDFVGIELQALDTTGTLWPERQRFLHTQRVEVNRDDIESKKGFGMNWKMTAKTILVQLHHKIQTFENVGKHLVLVVQDYFLAYMKGAFQFDHLNMARIGEPMHLHAYRLVEAKDRSFRLDLSLRLSTDTQGIARCLGLQADANVELSEVIRQLEAKISEETRFRVV